MSKNVRQYYILQLILCVCVLLYILLYLLENFYIPWCTTLVDHLKEHKLCPIRNAVTQWHSITTQRTWIANSTNVEAPYLTKLCLRLPTTL